MTDSPPGEWSYLLVGHQWPNDGDLAALHEGKTNRQTSKTAFSQFADALRCARTCQLNQQRGFTIADLRNAFLRGETLAERLAEKNRIKADAYGTSYDSMLSLRSALSDLAEDGNQNIQQIRNSPGPAETKVVRIAAAITHYRALANLAAAKYGANVSEAIQRIVDEDLPGQSARQFAQAHGIDMGQLFRQPEGEQDIKEQVQNRLEQSPGSQAGLTNNNLRTHTGRMDEPRPTPTTAPTFESPAHIASSNLKTDGIKLAAHGVQPPALSSGLRTHIVSNNLKTSLEQATAPTPPPSVAPRSVSGAPLMTTTGIGSPIPQSSYACQPSAGPLNGQISPAAPSVTPAPAELMQSFNKGMESGAPFSAPANAVPTSPMSHTEPQLPSTPPNAPSAGISGQVHAPVFESPSLVQHGPAPEAPPPPIVAGSVAPNPATPMPAATGQLPTYGADLRPAMPTATPTAPPPSPPPLPATPSSAPVHPSAGQASTNQPPVVRQAPQPATTTAPSNVGAQAVFATASGAVAGAASADVAQRARLQKIVAAVARQQPRLAWAAGDRADDTTVLATDLASGWIPPGIALPAALTLLQPARRSGNLEAVLGEVSTVEAYTPMHHVPDDDEPLATSPRPRQTETIDEFAWKLSQATQWRDGLPRLAHTLAKAACAGTGVLDSEIAILREHLATTRAKVLDSYPENVNAHDVGNWQLLAAIDARAAGDETAANYHFAWFQACSR